MVGAGHSHLFVFQRLLVDRAFANSVKVIVFAPTDVQIYSGMIPGWISGRYQLDECSISLQRYIDLLREKGVDIVWVKKSIVEVDCQSRVLIDDTSGQHQADILSIDVGSKSRNLTGVAPDGRVIPVKPIAQLCQQITDLSYQTDASPQWILVVGAGAAAVELVSSLKDRFPLSNCALQVNRSLLPGFPEAVRKRAIQRLQRLGMSLFDQSHTTDDIYAAYDSVTPGSLNPPGESTDIKVFNATGVSSPTGIRFLNADKDDSGFLLVDEYHLCKGVSYVFAVGDICSRPGSALQRSGVHAVRAGPILADNLQRLAAALTCDSHDSSVSKGTIGVAAKRHLRAFKPRKNNLYLISMGAGWAILNWGRLTISGSWVWKIKDYIDRQFIKRFGL